MKKLVFLGIGVLVVIAIGMSACNSNKDNGKDQSIADSQSAKGLTKDTVMDNDPRNAAYDAALAQLKTIEVDPVTFKLLYDDCRFKGDEFSPNKYLYDRTSPQQVDINGIFAYINETNPGLRFCIQYRSENGLHIGSVAFIIDGQSFAYTPNFKVDNDGVHVLERSDEAVREYELPLMIKLATAKKVTVKFFGPQYYDIQTLPPQQQQAIKNMLMLYKGILMGYNGPPSSL